MKNNFRRTLTKAISATLAAMACICAFTITLTAQPAPKRVDKAPATATLIPVSENWRMDGDVPVHALILSLQGLANRDYPRIYIEYPKNWQWEIVHPLIEFLKKRHEINFERLATDDADAALARFAKYAKGYVVWDKQVRTSLTVAFTAAGVLDAVVVNEDYIALAEKHGLKKIEDLRGLFRGKNDFEIYTWAKNRYWDKCSRDYYVVLGGHAGPEMQPGIADFGIKERAFFADLSASPKHPQELALLTELLSKQNPASTVLGWHSYAKDSEGEHTTLTGNLGLKMEGLHNLPNVSFTCQIPLTPDFKYTNNHTVVSGKKYTPEKKVYLAAVSTDAMGIGSWTKPGRGTIPYAWQVLVNWSWMNPPALQYFYESKTPNDYFIGGLSGPGYMYPKSIPADKFPALMKDMRGLMKQLDLKVLEIMDFSEDNNADLTKEVVDLYYQEFPEVHGFINGYYAARTFDLRNGQPLMSYDYYLSIERTVEEAAGDLDEMIDLNEARPYFLLVHIRERNSIEKVTQMLARMKNKVEVVPLDVFLEMAAEAKTYKTRYRMPEDLDTKKQPFID